jgi:membrane-associated phospholipid phosphatase
LRSATVDATTDPDGEGRPGTRHVVDETGRTALPARQRAELRSDVPLVFLFDPFKWDGLAVEAVQALHWEPLTALFVLASTWWVKWPLFVAVGACGDARCRRRLPAAMLSALIAVGVAAGLTSILKDLFDRVRPALADPGVQALVPVPSSASFPSGHAATAFAAAVAVGAFYPRLRWPLLGLAALVGLSRIYLGVHYLLDVLAGAALGIVLGLAVAWAARRVLTWLARSGTSRRAVGTSFVRSRRLPG